MKRKMKDLEDNLLLKLTSVKGQLVDDVTVIQVLNTSKDTAAEINEKLIIAKETEIEINAAREEFRYILFDRGLSCDTRSVLNPFCSRNIDL